MPVAMDIACPECGRIDPVYKLALDRYRCAECGTEFGPGDVVPGP